MDSNELYDLEISLLKEGLYEAYGYDFRQYAEASFKRRIENFKSKNQFKSITNLLAEVLHDKGLFADLLNSISVTTSEMFRDPSVFRFIREKVIPYLKTFPHIRIWHAACGNGEEVFSLAILLKEEGIYDRCNIYATDFNESALRNTQKGIFSIKSLKKYSRNYQKSGGKKSLSQYYHAKYDHAKFDRELLDNVTLSNHNLASDSVFMEAQLIFCRNAMIYFNRELQNRVLDLFNDSLVRGGILCIGSKESLRFSSIESKYSSLGKNCKIYRKGVYAAQ